MKFKSVALLGIVAVLFLGNTGFAQELDVVSVPDDNRFTQQNFSQQLFWQIPQGSRACGFYGLVEYCSYTRRHIFGDSVLITEKDETASTTVTLIPNQSISRQQALSYASILDDSGEMDFTSSELQPGKVVYNGCSYNDGSGTIFLCAAELSLTSDGSISRIVVTHESP